MCVFWYKKSNISHRNVTKMLHSPKDQISYSKYENVTKYSENVMLWKYLNKRNNVGVPARVVSKMLSKILLFRSWVGCAAAQECINRSRCPN